MNRNIVIVSGPTGSGKSRLAIELCREFDGEVVSADSVAIYKYFDIGSAKPSKSELGEIKHHLVSELEPSEDFSAGAFQKLGRQRIEEILSSGKLPIVVGGTGLYIRALLNGLISDRRNDLDQEVSWDELYAVDPESASEISRNDRTRINRAYEHFKRAGKSIVQARREELHQELLAKALIILVEPTRDKLYDGINHRTLGMIRDGLVDETKNLIGRYPATIKPFMSIGYSHVIRFLKGELATEDDLVRELAKDTRRFAKRQLTWWRNQPKALGWTEMKETPILQDVTSAVRAFLEPNEKLGHTREIIRYTP